MFPAAEPAGVGEAPLVLPCHFDHPLRFFLDGWRGVNKSSLTINEYQICPNQIPVFIKEAAQGCRRYMGATKCSSGVRKSRSRFILQRFHLHGQVREIWVIYPH